LTESAHGWKSFHYAPRNMSGRLIPEFYVGSRNTHCAQYGLSNLNARTGAPSKVIIP
jgi:hypothetical protein